MPLCATLSDLEVCLVVGEEFSVAGQTIGESVLGRRGLPCQGFVLIKPLSFLGICVYLLLHRFGPGRPSRLTLWDGVRLFLVHLGVFSYYRDILASRVRLSGLRKGGWSLSRHIPGIHSPLMLLTEHRPGGGYQLASHSQLGQLCRC